MRAARLRDESFWIATHCHVCTNIYYGYIYFTKMPSTCKKCGSPNIIVKFDGSVYPPGHNRKYTFKFLIFIVGMFLGIIFTVVPIIIITKEIILIYIIALVIDIPPIFICFFFFVDRPKLREMDQYLLGMIQAELPIDISKLPDFDDVQDPKLKKRVKNPEGLSLKYLRLKVPR